ncbi:MAG: hypothetical protein HUK40_03290 [Desulfobacter sp.]|nr:hypothetical protein [Desulfobacter sp.]
MFAISFFDPDHGTAVGDWGTILMTDNGGKFWQKYRLNEDVILYGVARLSVETACAVGEMGRIFITRNKGGSWQEVDSPVASTLFCLCHEKKLLCAAGLDGAAVYSRDMGLTWNQGQTPVKESIYGISICGTRVLAVGNSGTLMGSENGGAQWERFTTANALPFWLGTISWARSGANAFSGIIAGANGRHICLNNNTIHWPKRLVGCGKEAP